MRFSVHFYSLLLCGLVAMNTAVIAQPAAESIPGPWGASVNSFTIGAKGEVLLMGSTGLFVSTDDARSWVAIRGSNQHGYLRAALGSPTGARFIAADDGTRRTTNNGQHWQLVAPQFDAMDASADGSIEIGHRHDSLYISNDDGLTWSPQWVASEVWSVNEVRFIDASIVLAGGPSALLRSTNGAKNWTLVTPALGKIPSLGGRMRVCVVSHSLIVAATREGMYSSKDQGATWQTLVSPFTQGFPDVSLAADSSGNVYAGSQWSIFRSSDGGANWWPLPSLPRKRVREMMVTPRGTLLAGLEYGGVDRYNTASGAWESASVGLTNTSIAALHFDAAGVFYASPDSLGMNISNDDGATWTHVLDNPYDYGDFEIISGSASDDPVFSSDWATGLYATTDHGVHWQQRSAGVFDVHFGRNNALFGEAARKIVFSNDKGLTWDTVQNAPPVYSNISSGLNGDLLIPHTDTLFYSSDNGATWQFSITPGYTDEVIENARGIAIRTIGDTLLRSSDHFQTWQRLDFPTNSYIYTIAITDGFFAVTNAGVYRSSDDGNTWQLVYASLGSPRVSSIAAKGESLYFGTYGAGIYRVTRAAAVSTDARKNAKLAVYPNPVSDLLQVDLGALRPSSIEIVNERGEVVSAVNTTRAFEILTLNISTLPTGAYTLRCLPSEATSKFVKR